MSENTTTGTNQLLEQYLAKASGSRDSALDMMMYDLWRNHPEWPSTFGPCKLGCDTRARGSGVCGDCIMQAMTLLIGDAQKVREFRDSIVRVRKTAWALRDLVENLSEQ